MRRAARVDRNQPEIVQALRQVGAFVQPLHTIGGGCPDILVGYRDVWHLMEIKDGLKPPSARALTADELRWHVLAAECAPVHTVWSIDQAFRIIGVTK